MAPRDAIAERNAMDEAAAFNSRVMEAKDEIVALVDTLMRWGGLAKYRGRTLYGGNVVLLVERGVGGERVVVQYPSPGVIHSEWRNELLENEVTALDVLGTFTTIPLPRVLFWGHADQSPRQLGPFLIRECLMTRGKPLTRLIGVPVRNGKEGELVLNPDVPDAVMDLVYEELAHMLLKVARMAFNRIGAISRSEVPRRWEVTWQPLTHDMNEVATMGDFPIDEFGKTGAFESAGAFFYARAHQFGTHLYRQRNIAGDDPNTAWKQFNARRFFGDAIPKYCTVEDDTGPFRFFCEGLQPANILVDDRTLRITGVANLGFANAMPAQHPSAWLAEDDGLSKFLKLFEPRKEQFLRAMERAEASLPLTPGPRLCSQMRESWDTGRFWFNLASRSSFQLDDIYWKVLKTSTLGGPVMDWDTAVEGQRLVGLKMKQNEQWERQRDNDERFVPKGTAMDEDEEEEEL